MHDGKTRTVVINKLCSTPPMTPESTALVKCVAALVKCVAALFPRRFCLLEKNKNNETFVKRLQSKNDTNKLVDVSEEGVKSLMINLLKRKIQTHHFNIVQIAFNVGKLAGILHYFLFVDSLAVA